MSTTAYPDVAPSGEDSIVWLEDIDHLDYVRVLVREWSQQRRRMPQWNSKRGGRLVGYSTLHPRAKRVEGFFVRRAFLLKPHDRDYEPDGVYEVGCPCEAVDPRTVAPGVWGEITERAWFGTGARAEEFKRRSVEEGWVTTPQTFVEGHKVEGLWLD